MFHRSFPAVLVCLCLSFPLPAQLSRDSKFEILRTVIADQASARIAMPFGTQGIELSESGEINKEKLDKEMKKNGQSIEAGKVVTVTDIDFGDDKIEIELDGGGKNKKSFTDRIQIGIGSGTQTVPVGRDDKTKKAKGSKIVLRFTKKSSRGSEARGAERNARSGFGFQQTQFPQDGHRCPPSRVSGSGQSQGSSDRYGSQHRNHGARPPG